MAILQHHLTFQCDNQACGRVDTVHEDWIIPVNWYQSLNKDKEEIHLCSAPCVVTYEANGKKKI